MILRWWRDWRERRSALREMQHLHRRDEAIVMDQNQNPLTLAKSCLASDPVQAATLWERARVIVPDTVLRSPDSLTILLELKRYDEAEALMRERQKRIRGDRLCLTGLARIAEARGDMEEALKRWDVVRRRVQDSLEGYVGSARCLVELDRLDEAEAELKRALRYGPNGHGMLVGLARISDRRKNWEQSIQRWRHLAETFQDAPAFAGVAKAMLELGRADEAEAYMAEPSRLYPSDLEIAVTYAHVAERRGDLRTACARWARVRATDPNFYLGYTKGARCLLEAGLPAEADAVLEVAIERFPDQAWPLREFARLAHDRKGWDEATLRWQALRERFPEEEHGYSLGAEALNAAGRHDEAALLRRAAG
jgi:tetratricopeptide (TPR) repeat protein